MVSSDREDHDYPQSVQELVPQYLTALPTCPAAGRETYSASYRATIGLPPEMAAQVPDKKPETWPYYRLRCDGENHTNVGVEANYPQYDSVVGLHERAP